MKIYNKLNDSKKVSSDDTYRNLSEYICSAFQSNQNKEKRTYAKSLINLVNKLTHDSTPSLIDAKISMDATISLIQLIRTIYDSFQE